MADHFSQLPRMSPTAGAGDQEYVAINVAAVFSLLVGFTSLLALMDAVLVIIAVVAVALAATALRQINRSNGTQTGAGIAMAALFLAVGIGSFVLASASLEGFSRQRDRQAIASLCQRFGQDMKDRSFDPAYDLFSQRFKYRVSRQDFVERLRGEQDRLSVAPGGLGAIDGCRWNGLALFSTDPDAGTVTARSDMMFHFAHADSEQEMSGAFRKSGDVWEIDDIPELFPPPAKPRR
jgi:hypothetical protein